MDRPMDNQPEREQKLARLRMMVVRQLHVDPDQFIPAFDEEVFEYLNNPVSFVRKLRHIIKNHIITALYIILNESPELISDQFLDSFIQYKGRLTSTLPDFTDTEAFKQGEANSSLQRSKVVLERFYRVIIEHLDYNSINRKYSLKLSESEWKSLFIFALERDFILPETWETDQFLLEFKMACREFDRYISDEKVGYISSRIAEVLQKIHGISSSQTLDVTDDIFGNMVSIYSLIFTIIAVYLEGDTPA